MVNNEVAPADLQRLMADTKGQGIEHKRGQRFSGSSNESSF